MNQQESCHDEDVGQDSDPEVGVKIPKDPFCESDLQKKIFRRKCRSKSITDRQLEAKRSASFLSDTIDLNENPRKIWHGASSRSSQ
jgi:hypothetical protein